MRQYDFAIDALLHSFPALLIVRIVGDNMCDKPGQWHAVLSSQRDDTCEDNIVVALGQMRRSDDDVAEVLARIGTMRSRLRLLALVGALYDP